MIEFRPAELEDLVAVRRATPRRHFQKLTMQIRDYPAWAIRSGEERLGLCGLAPIGSGVIEAWFLASTRLRHSPHRVAAMRALMLRLATVLPNDLLICRILEGHRAGERIARLSGFLPIDEWLPGTRVRTWVRPPDAKT
ncbi:hypothetical protein [Oricola sp.]|uniref:hypothetical protein n=1 Tax=Oricola sp. TaxID=1979950 RepID=UPI0025E9A589|nr:hypothetical protein [Oricola sp.]MCI5075653.1 hypothetical protein [Oricola sp.]